MYHFFRNLRCIFHKIHAWALHCYTVVDNNTCYVVELTIHTKKHKKNFGMLHLLTSFFSSYFHKKMEKIGKMSNFWWPISKKRAWWPAIFLTDMSYGWHEEQFFKIPSNSMCGIFSQRTSLNSKDPDEMALARAISSGSLLLNCYSS